MNERETEIKSGDIFLSGTLTTPDGIGPHPLVICIHGSGPLDRDENTPYMKLNIFNTLAKEFAQNGIACYRYDKRGVGKSGGHFMSAGHHDLVADALAVACHFETDPKVEKLILLGHSEGTIIAPQVAQKCKVEGLILLAPFITPLEELLALQGREMQRHIDTNKGITAGLVRAYTRFRGGVVAINNRLIHRVRKSTKPVLWNGVSRVPARWIRELLDINPAAIFSRVRCPTLVLVAGEDVQCPPKDGAEIVQVIGRTATHALIPELSHILRKESRKKGFAGYTEQVKKPMAAEVLNVVLGWLTKQDSRVS